MKPDYFFLDTWVLSRLTDENFANRLGTYLRSRRYTILVTSLSFVEIYNPGWVNSDSIDRMEATAHFLGKHPYAIIDPAKVFKAELESFPQPLRLLPTEDLNGVPQSHHAPVLSMFFRRDPSFLSMGKDIQNWADRYKLTKDSWLDDVNAIIENACLNEQLIRDSKGRFETQDSGNKEVFLFTLDFRHMDTEDPSSIDLMLRRIKKHGLPKYKSCCKAVRLSSLCFWYSYINIDQSNKMRRSGSDIGDFFHLSLLPYCRVFTIDNTMARMLQRVKPEAVLGDCKIVTSADLEALLKNTQELQA